MKVFWILNGNIEVASSRERVLQYLPRLEEDGIQSSLHILGNIRPGFTGRFQYWRKLLRESRKSDLIFLHRTPLQKRERTLLHRSRTPIIFDIDDAIWYSRTKSPAEKQTLASYAENLFETIKLSCLIRAGNQELADYLMKFGIPIQIAPTCVSVPPPTEKKETDQIRIGWIGSSENFPHIDVCIGSLKRLQKEFPHMRFRVIADKAYKREGIDVEFIPWILDCEKDLLPEIDIGIMPLLDDDWSRGKCGYKLLLYMAQGIPSVASPVGINRKIIENGKNGFLVETSEGWYSHLRELISNPKTRRELGEAARRTVQDTYTTDIGYGELRRHLRETLPGKNKSGKHNE